MNEVSLSQKVSDNALTSMSLQGNANAPGNLMCVGDADGVITLLRLCYALCSASNTEKPLIGAMLDRESKREKNLEQIKKSAGAGKKVESMGGTAIEVDEE